MPKFSPMTKIKHEVEFAGIRLESRLQADRAGSSLYHFNQSLEKILDLIYWETFFWLVFLFLFLTLFFYFFWWVLKREKWKKGKGRGFGFVGIIIIIIVKKWFLLFYEGKRNFLLMVLIIMKLFLLFYEGIENFW